MKLKQLIVLCAVAVVITACSKEEDQENLPVSTEPNISKPQETDNPISEGLELSEYEQELFDNYIKSLDINLFKDVSPISIAKIYIHCGITGNWKAEYNIFSMEDYVPSKEDFYEEHINEMALFNLEEREEYARNMFFDIGNAKYVELEDNMSYIYFMDIEGKPIRFMFIENSDGIKLPRFSPIEYVDFEDIDE